MDYKFILPDSGSSSGTEETNTPESTTRAFEDKIDILIPELLSDDMFLLPQYTRQGQHLYTGYSNAAHHISVSKNHYFMPIFLIQP